MASRTLPNLGLKAFFALGEDGWNDEVDSNFLKLSVLTQGGITGIVTTKPVSPSQGDVYLMSAAASSNPNAIAVYDDVQWKHFVPNSGWTVYNRADDSFVTWTGSEWKAMSLSNLRSLGAVTSDGIVEKAGSALVSRAIGVGSSASIPTLAHADARYAQVGHTHAATGVTAFNTRTGPVVLSSADVQTALGYVPQTTHPHLTSISSLGSGSGLIEQTGANAFAKRAIGTNTTSDILSMGLADQRYQGLHANLTGFTNVVSNENGVIEQFGPRTYRIRAIGSTNNTDLLTRGAADSLYLAASTFSMSQLVDVPDSYTGYKNHSLVVNQAENSFEFRAPGQVVVRDLIDSAVLALSDAGAHIRITHSSGALVTIPKNSTVAFPIGTTVAVEQGGEGTVTFDPVPGVNLDFRDGFANYTDNRHSVVFLRKIAADRWVAYGDLVVAPLSSMTADSVLIEADNDSITADAV
jgi:hypothetical protein